MNLESHSRARQLMAAARVEGIDASERDWLDSHLSSCHECSIEAGALAAAVQSLRGLPVAVSPEVVRRTRRAVQARSEQLQASRALSVPLWIATAVSSVWMILTAPYVWQTFAWLGRIGHIPGPVWQMGFLVWWFLPGTVLAAALAWRHAAKDHVSNWAIESDWGQL